MFLFINLHSLKAMFAHLLLMQLCSLKHFYKNTLTWFFSCLLAVIFGTYSVAAEDTAKHCGNPMGLECSEDILTAQEIAPPATYLDFCKRYALECDKTDLARAVIPLTKSNYMNILKVNVDVNHSIQSIKDSDHWGVSDRWDFAADGKGDCEDFALIKRRELVNLGFKKQTLLLTLVKNYRGLWHMLLSVRTDTGDYVLDSESDEITPWKQSPYRFIARQSETNLHRWMAIDDSSSRMMILSQMLKTLPVKGCKLEG